MFNIQDLKIFLPKSFAIKKGHYLKIYFQIKIKHIIQLKSLYLIKEYIHNLKIVKPQTILFWENKNSDTRQKVTLNDIPRIFR